MNIKTRGYYSLNWCFEAAEQTFYKNLNTDDGLVDSFPTQTEWKLNDDVQIEIRSPIILEKVRQALLDMKPHKSPGHDGFPTVFFQKN